MGVVTGPLFSLGASGTIAKTLTYGTWRGIKYVRQRVIPSNPRSTDQTEVRGIFSNLNQVFVGLPTNSQATWTEDARGRPYTARNKLIGRNAAALQGQADMSLAMLLEPRGLAPFPTGVNITDNGAQVIRVVMDAPPTIPDSSSPRGLAVALRTFNPDAVGPTIFLVEGTDVAGAVQIDLDVDIAGSYRVNCAWQWLVGGFEVTSGIAGDFQVVA